MPNYVKNHISFSDNDKVKEFMEDGFDFNKILPMPKTLNIISGSTTDDALSLLYHTGKTKNAPTFLRTLDELKERYTDPAVRSKEYFLECGQPKSFADLILYASIVKENLEKYNTTDWYHWCWSNWGTKWNACDAGWSDGVWFETAWSPVPNLIFKLCETLDVDAEYEYADEDVGANCGRIWIKNTDDGCVMSEETFEEDEAFRFACGVWGIDPDEELAWREENN